MLVTACGPGSSLVFLFLKPGHANQDGSGGITSTYLTGAVKFFGVLPGVPPYCIPDSRRKDDRVGSLRKEGITYSELNSHATLGSPSYRTQPPGPSLAYQGFHAASRAPAPPWTVLPRCDAIPRRGLGESKRCYSAINWAPKRFGDGFSACVVPFAITIFAVLLHLSSVLFAVDALRIPDADVTFLLTAVDGGPSLGEDAR